MDLDSNGEFEALGKGSTFCPARPTIARQALTPIE